MKDIVERLIAQSKARIPSAPERTVEYDAAAEIESLRSRLAEVTRERDGYKIRGDGHWETLRSIRQMDDVGQIRQWISDSASGYVEANEETLFRINEQLLATQANAARLAEALAQTVFALVECGAECRFPETISDAKAALSTPVNLDALYEDRAQECERLAEMQEGLPGLNYVEMWLREQAAAHRAKKEGK